MEEGFWIEPDGTPHSLGWQLHDDWARDWIEKHSMQPSRTAAKAVELSRETKPDAGPAFFELLRRGWVRQRGRVFTVWRFVPQARRCIAKNAAHCGFRSVGVEVRNSREVRWMGTFEVRGGEGLRGSGS
ncbi:MAG: hypothetical protein HY905_01670 [Deltaproteobacteria bacterium]|nr:hypothetical protein [Deltaproteobacteria bacterium]